MKKGGKEKKGEKEGLNGKGEGRRPWGDEKGRRKKESLGVGSLGF